MSGIVRHACHALAIDEKRGVFRASLWEAKPKEGQTVEQVWFPGVHGDIGGDGREGSLASAPFEWMKERASASGLALDESGVGEEGGSSPSPGWMQWVWGLLPSYVRPIGGDSTQWVHRTARDRFQAEGDYSPKNLGEYLGGGEGRVYGEGGIIPADGPMV